MYNRKLLAAVIVFVLLHILTQASYSDDCSQTPACDVTTEKGQPLITYPCNETVYSLTPRIGFIAQKHDAVRIVIENGDIVVWDSGAVATEHGYLDCKTRLAPDTEYTCKVAAREKGEWTEFSEKAVFRTLRTPFVKIVSPKEADSLWGTEVEVAWRVETTESVNGTRVFLDGKDVSDVGNSGLKLRDVASGLHRLRVEARTDEGLAADEVVFHIFNTPACEDTVYYYDVSWALGLPRKEHYDVMMAVFALQGLVNREKPRLFVKYVDEDDRWLERLSAKGYWLEKTSFEKLETGPENLGTLFEKFSEFYKGFVVWDPDVAASSCVATTVAGAEDLIPIGGWDEEWAVRRLLASQGLNVEIEIDLQNKFTGKGKIWQTDMESSGSAKNDAYIWARAKYLETGKCAPDLTMCTLDSHWIETPIGAGHQLPNRDYLVMNRGFVMDLGVWDDEKPVDDPLQETGLDASTFKSVLYECAKRSEGMVHNVGFIPWPFKYTDFKGYGDAGGRRGGVDTEWELVRILSDHNAYMDADTYGTADVANASFYSHFPSPDRYPQVRKTSFKELRKGGYIDKPAEIIAPKNYLNMYMGDYDAGAWLVYEPVKYWEQDNRGKLPFSWPFNPNLAKRMGPVYDYYRRTASDVDSFIAGDCGAGYVNPSALYEARRTDLGDARGIWIDHNLKWYRKAGLKLTGFVINGHIGPITPADEKMYSAFSPDGIFSNRAWFPDGHHRYESMPCLAMWGDVMRNDLDGSARHIQSMGKQNEANFECYRIILVGPDFIEEMLEKIREADPELQWELMDTRTWTALLSAKMGMENANRAVYSFDTFPETAEKKSETEFSVGCVNDGWDTWHAKGEDAVTLKVALVKEDRCVTELSLALKEDVESSDGVVFDVSLCLPHDAGRYTLTYQMYKGDKPFSSLGDYAWEKDITIE